MKSEESEESASVILSVLRLPCGKRAKKFQLPATEAGPRVWYAASALGSKAFSNALGLNFLLTMYIDHVHANLQYCSAFSP